MSDLSIKRTKLSVFIDTKARLLLIVDRSNQLEELSWLCGICGGEGVWGGGGTIANVSCLCSCTK